MQMNNQNQTQNITPEMLVKQATKRQNNAANGAQSVWVSASAGTGKTYVLTKRILGLLLKDNSLKTQEILAVTFTRAAAREMEERIRTQLSFWATCENEVLEQELEKMLNEQPSKAHIKRARTLFAEFLDNPVESNTLHGFCQKILAQFPLEAGISPTFKLIEGQDQAELLKKAKASVFMQALDGTLKPAWVFDFYAYTYGEKSLSEALDGFVADATRFRKYLQKVGGIEGFKNKLSSELGVDSTLTSENLQNFEQQVCILSATQKETIQKGAEALLQGAKTAQKYGEALKIYLHENNWRGLQNIFLVHDNNAGGYKPRSGSFPDKKALEFGGDALWENMHQLAEYILSVEEKLKAANAYLLTVSYLELGSKILTAYEDLKHKNGALDFDDLIDKTTSLLKDTEKGEWVRFKMDEKIRHVLLDEAQDTDSDQWHILKSIVDEFYAGVGQYENRTFFAVGDMKQSIYRFRGAQPHVFGSMREYLHMHKTNSDAPVAVEEMMVSFRSTEPVLNFVDMVFAENSRHQAVDNLADKIEHNAVKVGSSGTIHIAPLLEKEEELEEKQAWQLPSRQKGAQSLSDQISEQVAQRILSLLNSTDVLESTGRHIQAGDIMILLRKRTFMPAIIDALDRLYIPHSGADLVTLQNETVVQDMLAMLKFAANQDDDLSLAHVLRSPLFGLDDASFDGLFIHKKQHETLWQKLDKNSNAAVLLNRALKVFKTQRLQSFLTWVIQTFSVRGVYYGLLSTHQEKSSVVAVDDALDMLLDMAMDIGKKGLGAISLIHKIDTQIMKLKREMDVGNKVRIMTAHGSKGLESPIVIMPDTTRSFYEDMAKEKRFWRVSDDGEDQFFLHKITSKDAPELQNKLADEEKERIFKDEMRLLYVALTRAKERVYISGVKNKKYNAENCWYGHVLNVVQNCDRFDQQHAGDYLFRVENNLTAEQEELAMETVEEKLPSWVQTPAENERGLTLVNASDSLKRKEQLKLLSEKDREKLFKRGQLVHKLLEFLPHIEPSLRKEKGLLFLKQAAADYHTKDYEEILQSALMVMETYPQFFAENSKAEVAVAANFNAYRLEGVVDRLVVDDESVVIVDYKTNAEVPEEIPEAYAKQMHFYKKALAGIYPQKQIKAAILWTSLKSPRLDWL